MKLRLLFALLLVTNIVCGTTELPPPSNDDFANAIPITCGNNYVSSTAEATLDENDAPDSVNPTVDLDAPNIWYSYTGSGTPETVTLDLCASGYDTSYLVYTGTSGNLTLVASNDDNADQCGPGYRSYGTFESDGTTTYYITITGYDPTSIGSVDLTVSCVANLPTPNTVELAIPITPSPEGTGCDGGNYTFNLDFTNSGTTDSGMSGCLNGDLEGIDQFFTWTATTRGLQFNTPSFSGRAGIIIRNGNAPYDVIDCTKAIDDYSAIFTGWNIGDNLIIQVYKGQGQTGTADAIFCLEEKTIVSPVNDTVAGAIPITPAPAGSACSTTSNNQTIFFNTDTYTTTDSGTNTICEGENTGVDQFFTWTATSTGLLWGQNPDNLGIAVRSTSGVEYGCIVWNQADPIKLSGWQLGEDLIIQIFNYEYYHYDSISFCLREYNTSVNDLITGAIPITPDAPGTCNERTLFISSDGTTDSGLDGTCNGENTGYDQFFTWTATTNALLWSGLTENPGIVIRDTAGNEITCADTIAPDNTVLSGWEVGDELVIQIYDWVFTSIASNVEQSYRDVTFCIREHTIIPPAITSVPDDNFEQALIDLGYDDVLDDGVLTSNINTIQSLSVTNKNIADLTGIQDFGALRVLDCSDNQLTTLDVSQNLGLENLNFADNAIQNINLTQNTALIELQTNRNYSLGTIDLSQNTSLEVLKISQSGITSIDLSANTALKTFEAAWNFLTFLDVSQNVNLETLFFAQNSVSSIDVSSNTALQNFSCTNNPIQVLDMSNNPQLRIFSCTGTDISMLNLKNGNNTNIQVIGGGFYLDNNPNLTCVEVDDPTYSNANWVIIDPGLTFSTDCNYSSNDECVDAISVPISNTACDTTVSGTLAFATNSGVYQCFGNLDGFSDVWYSFVATDTTHNIKILNTSGTNSRVFHTVIDAQTYTCGNITDAVSCSDGLENQVTGLTIGDTYFLQVFTDVANSTETFDVCISTNTIPGQTYVPDDNFEQALIDLGYDTVLDDYVTTANINTIDVLDVSNRNIGSLIGIEDFAALRVLLAFDNQLTSINVAQNSTLEDLSVKDNSLSTLDISQNLALKIVNAGNNNLTSVDLSQNTALEKVNFQQNQLTAIDVMQNPALEDLTVPGNAQISSVNVSNNPSLVQLSISDTQISTLDLSNNTNLTNLFIANCPVSVLDISSNLALEFLSVSGTQLTTIDVSDHPVFDALFAENTTTLTSINVQNGNNTNFRFFFTRNTPNLACVQVDNVAYSTTNWTDVDAGTNFSLDCGFLENDECVNAISIPISNATCNNTVSGTLAGATNSNSLQCFGPSAAFSDVWYSFVATETSHNISILNTTGDNSGVFHALIDAQTYNCGNITQAIYCADGLQGLASEATGLTIGNTYYLQIFTYSAGSTETFDVCVSTNSIPGQTYVPDNNFEQALIDLGLDTVLDDYVTTANINTVNDLNIRDLSIFDLTGIEDFAGLEILNCGLNFLGEVDLSNNTNLTTLIADNAALTELNVKNGNNTNVTTFITLGNVDLFCVEVDNAAYSTTNWTLIESSTSFSENCGPPENDDCANAISVPISNGTCNNTVSGTLLSSTNSNAFNCFGSADFSDVWFSFVATETTHNIKTLNTSGTNARVFHAVIDAQTYNCGNITDAVYCTDDVEGQATGLTIGNTYYIQVYTDVVNTTETFDVCVSTNSVPGQTYVPDDNFEQALIDLGYDTVLDDYVTTANINTVATLDVINKNIIDLTGIEAFVALEELFVDNNNITTTINLTQNPLLNTFFADGNTMTSLDVSQNPLLETLYLGQNSISTLDISQNPVLRTLFVDDNSLTMLDISQNPVLRNLVIRRNNISTLDISQNPQLAFLAINDNSVSTIDLSQSPELRQAYLSNNNLSTVDVTQNPFLEDLTLSGNTQIQSVDVSTNPNLKRLSMSLTQVSALDLSNNVALEELYIVNCPITQIDFSTNTALKLLSASGIMVASIDMSQNPSLEELYLGNNSVLTNLNVQNGNNTNLNVFNALNTPNLACVQVDDVAYSTTNWTNVDAGINFSLDCGFPANDNCINAISVPVSDATCNNTISGTMNLASNSGEYFCFGESTGFSDVWFSFVATETTHNIKFENIVGPQGFLLRHALIDAETYNCGNITETIYCTDNFEGQATGLTIGNTYYIQAFSYESNMNTTFDLCVSTNSIPGQTYVPDNNFEQALIDLGLDTVLDDYVTTANINTINDLNIRDLGIFDLTGIEDFAALEILNCGLNFLGELDLSNNTNLNYLIADNAGLVALNMKNGNNTNVTTFITLGNVDLFCIQVDDAAYSTTNWTLVEQTTSFSEFCGNPIQVAAKVYLQGAMLNTTDGFMRTDLKDNNHISAAGSPYADGIDMSAEVFNATAQDRVVDWIWVELRDATNPAVIIDGKSAVLQRDGDIVDATASDTVTPVSFSQEPDDYYIVIKHRNHLGIMSDGALTLSNTTLTTIDFSDRNNQVTFGANAQTNFGMPADIVGMWSGNVNGDTVVQYSGTTPDTPGILSRVLNDVGNFLNFPTYTVSGYDTNDVNMDGSTQYTGTTPDTPFILQNVLAHPGNFLNFSTFQIIEQLPENE